MPTATKIILPSHCGIGFSEGPGAANKCRVKLTGKQPKYSACKAYGNEQNACYQVLSSPSISRINFTTRYSRHLYVSPDNCRKQAITLVRPQSNASGCFPQNAART